MVNPLSILGIVHTVISVIALVFAFVSLFRYGKINTKRTSGSVYIILTILACLTSFPIMRTGQPTPGHFLAVMILLLLVTGLPTRRIFKNSFEYVQTISLSTTLFLSLVPAVNETFTRVPFSHPLASGPDAPVIKLSAMVLAVLFFSGVTWQVIRIRASRKAGGMNAQLSAR